MIFINKLLLISLSILFILMCACSSTASVSSFSGSTNASNSSLSKPITAKKEAGNPSGAISESLPIMDDLLPLKDSESRTQPIFYIVIHFSSNVDANPKDPFNLKDMYNVYDKESVSPHYVIDRDGKIYRMVNENRVAFHAGRGSLPGLPQYTDHLNDYSIGIECLAVGSKQDMNLFLKPGVYETLNPSYIGYTSGQYQSLNLLIKDILSRYPTIRDDREHIIGHEDYSPGRRTDPGTLFDWSKIGLPSKYVSDIKANDLRRLVTPNSILF